MISGSETEEMNFNLYPNEAFQRRWLRIYLEERARLTGQSDSPPLPSFLKIVFNSGLAFESVSVESVHSLYEEVNKFALVRIFGLECVHIIIVCLSVIMCLLAFHISVCMLNPPAILQMKINLCILIIANSSSQ